MNSLLVILESVAIQQSEAEIRLNTVSVCPSTEFVLEPFPQKWDSLHLLPCLFFDCSVDALSVYDTSLES